MALTWDQIKANERREKDRKEIEKIKAYIEGMKKGNEKFQNRIDNEIDVNPETVCKPIGVETWSAGKQSGTRPKYSDECLRHRRAINFEKGRIKKNLEMIKIQEAKLIKKQSLFDKGITIIEEPKTLQERGGYEIRGVPKSGSITFSGITENSVLVSWNFNQGDSPITSYHLVIKDEDTRQTKYETNFYVGGGGIVPTSTLISNLDSGTNYTAFIIATNEIGNSIETSKGFKTKGVTISTAKKPSSVFIKETEDTTDSSFIPDLIPTIPEVYADTPTITISPEVQAILTKFDNNDYDYPYTDLLGVMNQVKDGTLSNKKFLDIMNYLLEHGTIIDKTIPSPIVTPVIDTNIDNSMVTQSIGAFKLENNRVKGSIIYIAESSFNPYYYNKSLTSIVSIKDQSGRTVKLKTNNLNFTATERDETINIDEDVGELDAVKIEFLVWKSVDDPIAFSKKKVDEIVSEEVGLAPCPLGQHRNFSGKCVPDDPIIGTSLLGKVMGVTAILGTLALLGSKGR